MEYLLLLSDFHMHTIELSQLYPTPLQNNFVAVQIIYIYTLSEPSQSNFPGLPRHVSTGFIVYKWHALYTETFDSLV